MLSLIFANPPFPSIIVIFLSIVLLEVNIFSNYFKSFNSSGIGSKLILWKTAWQGISFLEGCL